MNETGDGDARTIDFQVRYGGGAMAAFEFQIFGPLLGRVAGGADLFTARQGYDDSAGQRRSANGRANPWAGVGFALAGSI